MNSEALAEIIGWLAVIYDPHASNEQRQLAQKRCDQLKDDVQAPLYGHYLAHCASKQSDTVRYFGLGLLEDAVRFKWHTGVYAPDDKVRIREAVVDLITGGLLPSAQEPKFIKEKTARILAELVERVWPQNWPELESLLESLYASSESTQELAMMVLRYIAEDVFQYSTPVTVSRRDDLRNSLIAITSRAPAVMDEATPTKLVPVEVYRACGVAPGNEGWLARVTASLFSNVEAYASTTGPLQLRHEYMATLCLNTITAYLEWLPLESIVAEGTVFKIFGLLVHGSKEVRVAASEAALLITARKFGNWEDGNNLLLKPLLSQGGVDVVRQAWAAAQYTPASGVDMEDYLEDNYLFIKRLTQIWINVGVDQICIRKAPKLPDGFQLFLDFALSITQHPSLSVGLMIMHFWHTAFRHELVGKSPALAQCVRPLFDTISAKISRALYTPLDEDDAALGCRCSFADFPDSLAEFQMAFGSFRSQSFSIVKAITERDPLYVYDRCLVAVQTLLTLPLPAANDRHRNKVTGVLTMSSPYYVEWETTSALLTAVHQDHGQGSRNPQNATVAPALLERMRNILNVLLAFNAPHEPLVIGRQLDAMTLFTEVVKADPNQFAFPLLQKVFTFVTFTLPNEPKTVDVRWELCEDSLALRRKACTSLLRLGMGMADVLMSIYEQIGVEIQRLIDGRLVGFGEKSYLTEFRASVIHHSTTVVPAQKLTLYSALFDPLAAEMVSAEVTEKIQSMPNFLDTIGLTLLANMVRSKTTSPPAFTDPAVVAALKERKSFRSYLLYLVNTYKSCLARSVRTGQADMTAEQRLTIVQSSPWAIHLQKILPQVLALLRNVHALWDRSAHWADGDVAKLPLELAPVLDMTPAERAVILGATPSEVAEEEQQRSQHAVSSLATHLHDIRNSLRLIKETVYALLGQATYLVPGEYFYASTSPIASEPTFAQCILDHVFGSVASMDTYHWRVLIQTFVKPFILNCPAERLNDTLRPVLIPVAAYLAKKLDAEWKDLIKRGLVQAGTLAEAQSMEGGNGMTFGDDDALDVSDPSSVSEEVVQQKMLRDLTRAWTEVWCVVFQLSLKPDTPSAVAGKGKSSATVTSDAATVKPKTAAAIFPLHKDLVEMTLSCMEISEPLLFMFLNAMTWKDTRTCMQAARVFSKLLPLLITDANFHPFLGKHLIMGALRALHDGYHQEGHDTLVALLVDVYVSLHQLSPYPAETMRSAIPSLADPDTFAAFESRLKADATTAGQRKIIREVLKDMIGVKPGQWFRKLDAHSSAALVLSVPERLYIRKQQDESKLRDEIGSDSQQDLGLCDLFTK